MPKIKIHKGPLSEADKINTLHLVPCDHDTNIIKAVFVDENGDTRRTVNQDDHLDFASEYATPTSQNTTGHSVKKSVYGENRAGIAATGFFRGYWNGLESDGTYPTGFFAPSALDHVLSNANWTPSLHAVYGKNNSLQTPGNWVLDSQVVDLLNAMGRTGNFQQTSGDNFAVWRADASSAWAGENNGNVVKYATSGSCSYFAYWIRALGADINVIATRINGEHVGEPNRSIGLRKRSPSHTTITPADGWVRVESIRNTIFGYDIMTLFTGPSSASVLWSCLYHGCSAGISLDSHKGPIISTP